MLSEEPRCPRCESTNTKFCYYNNDRLAQPRHCCKSCRRYWTAGRSCRKDKPSRTTSLPPTSPFHSERSGMGRSLNKSTSVPSLSGPIFKFVEMCLANNWPTREYPEVCSYLEKGGMHSLDRFRGKPRLVLQGDSSLPDFAHEDSDIEKGGMHSLDRFHGKPRLVLQGDSSFPDFAHEDSDIEKGGMQSNHFKASMRQDIPCSSPSFPGFYIMCKACRKTFSTAQAWEDHRLSHPGMTPTKSNVSVNTSTMQNHVSSGEVTVHAHEDSAIEKGGTHTLDRVHGGPRWAIVVDPLFDLNVQGAFALVAIKTSNGSSPAKDVLLRFLVFVYVLGFLSALGSKLFRSSKMGVIGSVAAALGFLMTMALLLI